MGFGVLGMLLLELRRSLRKGSQELNIQASIGFRVKGWGLGSRDLGFGAWC